MKEQTLDLFAPVTRDQRQEEFRINWIKHKCCGTAEWATGTGKTRAATNCISCVLEKYPDFKVIVIVPTQALQEQWITTLDSLGLGLNCQVLVINTAIRETRTCDLLVIDELHRVAADSFSQVFKKIKYRLILGLTATFERLDGKHELIEKYCPVIDTITLEEARRNGWVSEYKEYQVIIDVDDIEEYNKDNVQFYKHFDFFDRNFAKVMSLVGPDGFHNRLAYRDEICKTDDPEVRKETLKQITYHSVSFMRYLQARKAFINNHPKKIEIARRIIEARPNSKIITFSNNIKMAEQIGGPVYSGKDSKKKGRITMEEFIAQDAGVLNTIQKCNEGLNVPGLSVAIMLGIDSSKIKAVQRTGRTIRLEEPNKVAEIFNIVINDTAELEWFRNSHAGRQYITLDEKGLEKVLNGEEPDPYKKPLKKLSFRF